MKTIFSIRTILLIILIILFYNQIIALGLRIYLAFADNPRLEYILADYYQSAAKYNLEYANRFYQDLFTRLNKNVPPNTEGFEKFNSAMILGKLYECGYGTKQNADEAKSWYQEALNTAPSDQQKNILSQKLTSIEDASKKQKEKTKSDQAGQLDHRGQTTTLSEQQQAETTTESEPTPSTESKPIPTQTTNHPESGSSTTASHPPTGTPQENTPLEQAEGNCYVSEKPRLIMNLWKYFETGKGANADTGTSKKDEAQQAP